MFDHEVAIEEQGLNACQQGSFAVEVAPASLHHRQAGVREVRHRREEPERLSDAVAVSRDRQ